MLTPHNNPYLLFDQWLSEAKEHKNIAEPTAMSLATCADNIPSTRIVLLKEHDERGFVFYTNLQSHKGTDLKKNPHAELGFYWMPMERQIRISGKVEQVSDAQADAYFASRPRESQIGAWASLQSQALDRRETLHARIEGYTKQFEGQPVPRPPHWSGWRVVPSAIEFWQQGAFRIHERTRYTKTNTGWDIGFLYP